MILISKVYIFHGLEIIRLSSLVAVLIPKHYCKSYEKDLGFWDSWLKQRKVNPRAGVCNVGNQGLDRALIRRTAFFVLVSMTVNQGLDRVLIRSMAFFVLVSMTVTFACCCIEFDNHCCQYCFSLIPSRFDTRYSPKFPCLVSVYEKVME